MIFIKVKRKCNDHIHLQNFDNTVTAITPKNRGINGNYNDTFDNTDNNHNNKNIRIPISIMKMKMMIISNNGTHKCMIIVTL